MSYYSTPELKAERRGRSKSRRKTEQKRRTEARAGNALLYRGPAELAYEIRDLLADGKSVKAAMSGHVLRRATKAGRIALIDGDKTPLQITDGYRDNHTREANIILLADERADLTGWVLAEIIDTGSDIRVHISRLRELREVASPPLLALRDARRPGAPIMPPLMPLQPAWKEVLPETAEEIMRAALAI